MQVVLPALLDQMLFLPCLLESALGLVHGGECSLGLVLGVHHEGDVLGVEAVRQELLGRGVWHVGPLLVAVLEVLSDVALVSSVTVSLLHLTLRKLISEFLCHSVRLEVPGQGRHHQALLAVIQPSVREEVPALDEGGKELYWLVLV